MQGCAKTVGSTVARMTNWVGKTVLKKLRAGRPISEGMEANASIRPGNGTGTQKDATTEKQPVSTGEPATSSAYAPGGCKSYRSGQSPCAAPSATGLYCGKSRRRRAQNRAANHQDNRKRYGLCGENDQKGGKKRGQSNTEHRASSEKNATGGASPKPSHGSE